MAVGVTASPLEYRVTARRVVNMTALAVVEAQERDQERMR